MGKHKNCGRCLNERLLPLVFLLKSLLLNTDISAEAFDTCITLLDFLKLFVCLKLTLICKDEKAISCLCDADIHTYS
jgi:hypothetical protein